MARSPRDVERMYETKDVVAKLRRLADALEQEKPFQIQTAGERIGSQRELSSRLNTREARMRKRLSSS